VTAAPGPATSGPRPVGVAVVGTGGVAALHLSALARDPGARLVGVCDVVASRARHAAGAPGQGARWTERLDDVLAWPDAEAVIVCTPNDTHADLGGRVVASGRHLLVEKPLAIDLAGADRLIEAAERAGVVLMPGQTQRFTDTGIRVREAVEAGLVGRPTYARSSLLAGWIWGGWGSWVLDPARSGGHVVHNGVHGLDLVAWWLGDEPVEVVARGVLGTSGALRIHDHFSVQVRHRGGAVATVEVSRAGRPRSIVLRESVVAGSAGVVRQAPAGGGGTLLNEAGAVPLGFDAQAGFDREVGAWLHAIRSGGPPPVSAHDGRVALAAALAAERSLRTGRPERVEGVA
jgi:predicted dehydrogenase